jgi:hypothetical protein
MKIEVSIPDIAAVMKEEIAAGERAAKQAMAAAAGRMKEDWRQQVVSSGLGVRLSKTIRSRTYPEGRDSFDPAALVWTKAPEILGAHIRGVTIRSKDGFYLAIPTPAAGKGRGGRRITPAEWEQRRGIRLRFIYRRTGPSLLVAEKARINTKGLAVASRAKTGRGQVTAPIFLLVPQVKLKKRLDLDELLSKGASVDIGNFIDRWE